MTFVRDGFPDDLLEYLLHPGAYKMYPNIEVQSYQHTPGDHNQQWLEGNAHHYYRNQQWNEPQSFQNQQTYQHQEPSQHQKSNDGQHHYQHQQSND